MESKHLFSYQKKSTEERLFFTAHIQFTFWLNWIQLDESFLKTPSKSILLVFIRYNGTFRSLFSWIKLSTSMDQQPIDRINAFRFWTSPNILFHRNKFFFRRRIWLTLKFQPPLKKNLLEIPTLIIMVRQFQPTVLWNCVLFSFCLHFVYHTWN